MKRELEYKYNVPSLHTGTGKMYRFWNSNIYVTNKVEEKHCGESKTVHPFTNLL